MKKPTGVSRRLFQCIMHLQSNDSESALVNLFPALDQTAKRRWPKLGVGKRIKTFLQEEETLISIIATGMCISDNVCDGKRIPEILYKFGRTSIIHEGELDPRLEFNSSGLLVFGGDKWNLPSGYITGMSIAVMVAQENGNEYIDKEISFTVFDKEFSIDNLWGNSQEIKGHICSKFGNAELFKK